MKIDRIDIVFENCEHIEVPYCDVRHLYIGGISEYVLDNNMWASRSRVKNDFELKFGKYAKYALIILEDKSEYERVKRHNDITQIMLMSEDELVEHIDIHWKEGSDDYSNLGQVVDVEGDRIHIRINLDEEEQ